MKARTKKALIKAFTRLEIPAIFTFLFAIITLAQNSNCENRDWIITPLLLSAFAAMYFTIKWQEEVKT